MRAREIVRAGVGHVRAALFALNASTGRASGLLFSSFSFNLLESCNSSYSVSIRVSNKNLATVSLPLRVIKSARNIYWDQKDLGSLRKVYNRAYSNRA